MDVSSSKGGTDDVTKTNKEVYTEVQISSNLGSPAGLVTGISLLYSQEIGISTFIATITVFTIATVSRRFNVGYQSVLIYGVGISTVLIPFAVYFGVNGALGKAISTMVEYPSYIVAGFGALPYPTIIRAIPEGFSFKAYIESIFNIFGPFLYFYAPGFYAVVGSYLAIRVLLKKWHKDEMLLSTLLIFGIFSFNTALGRSDTGHIKYAIPAAVILFFIIAEKIFFVVKEETIRVDRLIKNRALLTTFVSLLLIIGYVYGLSAVVPVADNLYLNTRMDTEENQKDISPPI